MVNFKTIKIFIVTFFLLIVYHFDKLSLFNGLILILNVLDKVTGVFDIKANYFEFY